MNASDVVPVQSCLHLHSFTYKIGVKSVFPGAEVRADGIVLALPTKM